MVNALIATSAAQTSIEIEEFMMLGFLRLLQAEHNTLQYTSVYTYTYAYDAHVTSTYL